MVDDVKKQNVTFLRIVFLEQGLADLKMDELFFLLCNEGVCSLLHPVMQEFVAATLSGSFVLRIIQLFGIGKIADQLAFEGRQQILIDLTSSFFADVFQRFHVKVISDAGCQA